MNSDQPLVSIVMWIKNGERTVKRALTSILAQEYQNYEFLVQDGASTDGTLDILRSYFDRFEGRMKVVSEADRCGEDGLFKVFKRCRGELIGSCLADEELMPNACIWAINNFRDNPNCAAVYGDCYGTDIDGNITSADPIKDQFDLIRYVCHEIVPPFSSTFFRRESLQTIGLHDFPWALTGGEFELWVRLGSRFPIKYCPGFVSKFASHPGCQTNRPEMYTRMVETRKKVIERFFADPIRANLSRELQATAIAGMYSWMAYSIINVRALEEAREHIEQALRHQPILNPERVKGAAEHFIAVWKESVARI